MLEWRFFKKYFIPKKRSVYILSLMVFLETVITSVNPYIFGRLIDSMYIGRFSFIVKLVIIFSSLNLLGSLLNSLESFYRSSISQKIINNVKLDIFQKIVHMKLRKIEELSAGELINRIEGDASEVVIAYIDFFVSIIQVSINIVIPVYFAVKISIPLAICSLLFLPFTYIVTEFFKKKYKENKHAQKVKNDRYFGVVNEVIHNITGVKGYCIENYVISKIKIELLSVQNVLKQGYLFNSLMNLSNNFAGIMFDGGIILLATFLIASERLTIGSFVSFNQYINLLYQAIQKLMGFSVALNTAKVSSNRIIEFFNEKNLETDIYQEDGECKIYSFEFRDVSFGYNKVKILHNFNLLIEKPGFYSLVGTNGSGKSTFLKLAIGFYTINEGKIFFNGEEKTTTALVKQRICISYISKNIFIFNDTMKFNLSLNGMTKIEELTKVCEMVGLKEFIESLKDGYDTILGENGVILSSGTKQKIAIARAILKNSSLWLCDEITSDLDGAIEKEIIKIIKSFSQSKIIFFVSHKVSSIFESDNIFLLNNGNVEMSGNNKYLMDNSLLYRKLFKNNFDK